MQNNKNFFFYIIKQWHLPKCFALLSLTVILTLSGCSWRDKPPFYATDVSHIPPEQIEIYRYEQMLFVLNPYQLREEIAPHVDTYQFFLGDAIDEPGAVEQLINYVTDPLLRELYQDTQETWPDTQELSETLSQAFRRYRHHLPDEPQPRFYTFVSGLDYHKPLVYEPNHMAIGLDNYLGADYHYYEAIGIPAYLSRRMQSKRLPTDIFLALAEHHLHQTGIIPETLLEHMINEGKKLYFVDCMLPFASDETKINYTPQQKAWMEAWEGHAWTYKMENDLLFSSTHDAIQKFTREAPFTAPFSAGSAPRTGTWIGWRIVREYMRRNPHVSLQDLIREDNAQKILGESRYRPR